MVVGLPVNFVFRLPSTIQEASMDWAFSCMSLPCLTNSDGSPCDATSDHPSVCQSPTTSDTSFEHESNKLGHAKQGKAFPCLQHYPKGLIGRLGKVLHFTDGPLIPFQGFVEDLQLRKSLDDLGILLLQVLGFANVLPEVKERRPILAWE